MINSTDDNNQKNISQTCQTIIVTKDEYKYL